MMTELFRTISGPDVVIVNHDFRASGTVAKSIEIAVAARRRGLAVELWSVSGEGPMRARVPSDIPVRSCNVGAGLPRAFALTLAVPALARMIRLHRPAVLVSGGNHSHLPVSGAAWLSGLRGQMRLVLRASNSSRRPGREPGFVKLSKYLAADRIVAVAEALRPEIEASGTSAAIDVIANGVDIARIDRMAALGSAMPDLPPGEGPLLVAMGRLAPQKGFDLLIETLARWPDLRLVIAGTGPEEEDLRLMAQKLSLQRRVRFAGYLDNPFPLIRAADVFVMPSRWEGASNVLLEALACGVKIVATDCPTGNAEMLGHGRFGTLARPNDVADLAASIAIELETLRPPRAQRGRVGDFAIDRCMNDWAECLMREVELARGISVLPFPAARA
ncbi:glycosyltransferase [Croceicoccus pelagius]|uniref:Glycosyl transferase n=1 Tax=Croceicoccus pelagius TaxID=1703341 RepID=A0A916YKW6_9SPHN|nr:glycosyltransferase [Croceicoccus pelagius]GGD49507.1 glycosyl transferase [Croceicoccus pelagius]